MTKYNNLTQLQYGGPWTIVDFDFKTEEDTYYNDACFRKLFIVPNEIKKYVRLYRKRKTNRTQHRT